MILLHYGSLRQRARIGFLAKPPRTSALPNLPNGHNSATSWCGTLIRVSLDSFAGGAARAGLPMSRLAVVGVLLRVFRILLESGARLSRT